MKKYFLTLIGFLISITCLSQIQEMGIVKEGIITIESSSEIKNIIQKKIEYNTTKKEDINNYRIQLFYGSENGAIKTQYKFRQLFPRVKTDLEFDSPNWKVKVGDYKTRLIADKYLHDIILQFSDAIVMEPKSK